MFASHRPIRILVAFALMIWMSAFHSAAAATLAAPSGPVVLTVSGKISQTNGAAGAQFDVAMLEALPGRVAKVTTPGRKV